MECERLEIVEAWKIIEAKHACLDYSKIEASGAEHMHWEDVSLVGTKIMNANMSHFEVDGAQMGGAYIHNIGIPKEGDLHYNPDIAKLPVRFEHCDFHGAQFTKCDLSNVELMDCEVKGMKINGILVEDLLKLISE
ncbi:pentapeptide repeat-containing protein [Paenibacillus mendelii]|uniref:Pentapeptide repeat-containing protein n=1 Tax=Paenibacillus mendelii TaxID=206163 RepID=A0ABV6JGH3_9BACL|nr:pentapeptide repeat-containing protein [Paenibacillus mendelii]MCQ6557419.1 pentapeptide repeat-containing protein [Paenibacillus mendelii]